jgi:hypothetical protein
MSGPVGEDPAVVEFLQAIERGEITLSLDKPRAPWGKGQEARYDLEGEEVFHASNGWSFCVEWHNQWHYEEDGSLTESEPDIVWIDKGDGSSRIERPNPYGGICEGYAPQSDAARSAFGLPPKSARRST